MPYKSCDKCKEPNGVRTIFCKKCGQEFIIESKAKIKEKKTREVITDFSQLTPGDFLKVKNGPYHIVKGDAENKKIYMGEKGKCTFIKKIGDYLLCHSNKEGSLTVYVGENKDGKYISHMRPHKVYRLKKAHVNSET